MIRHQSHELILFTTLLSYPTAGGRCRLVYRRTRERLCLRGTLPPDRFQTTRCTRSSAATGEPKESDEQHGWIQKRGTLHPPKTATVQRSWL